MKDFLFLGGDLRMIYAARQLGKRFNCYVRGFDEELPTEVPRADKGRFFSNVVLPLPASVDGININAPHSKEQMSFAVLPQCLADEGTLFTSKRFPFLEEICERHRYKIVDYFSREELALMNAVPTAEGAIEVMLGELAITLFGAEILIVGFGRIGKIMVRYLTALGASVTVCARKYSALAEAELLGCKTVDLRRINALEAVLPRFDVIVNTVPATIFGMNRLLLLRKDCLFVDLASKSGVEDLRLAADAGVRVVWAQSLPGRTAPVSAGEIIGRTIENIMLEGGEIYVG